MLEQIYLALENKCLINPDQAIVLGVSGGPDSLCMLESMHQLGYRLIVAHLDHALRPSSVSEREKIEQISERKGLPFIFQREDVASFAQKNRQSLEEAARTLRYRFLLQQAEKTGAQAVAVGHTADDQVETVLMHFLRGSGLSGLRGMDFRSLPNPWSTHIPLVRPLLGIWREEILAFLKQHDLEPNLDESNQDLRFYRNRLRNELIPRLDELNPGLRERIWQTAGIISADDEALDMVVDRIWMKLNIELGAGYLSFEGESL
jgi:tRNA(Ile)-lysidine synthase